MLTDKKDGYKIHSNMGKEINWIPGTSFNCYQKVSRELVHSQDLSKDRRCSNGVEVVRYARTQLGEITGSTQALRIKK